VCHRPSVSDAASTSSVIATYSHGVMTRECGMVFGVLTSAAGRGSRGRFYAWTEICHRSISHGRPPAAPQVTAQGPRVN